MSNPNDQRLNIDPIAARLPVPNARPRGTHQPDIAGTSVQGARHDVSLPTPTPGPSGSAPYTPAIPMQGNVPIGRPGNGIPQWPAPSLSAQTPRDPALNLNQSTMAPGHQALADAARVNGLDPQAAGFNGPPYDPDIAVRPRRSGSR